MNDYHGKMQKISPFDWDENVKFYTQILPYLYIFESLFSYSIVLLLQTDWLYRITNIRTHNPSDSCC